MSVVSESRRVPRQGRVHLYFVLLVLLDVALLGLIILLPSIWIFGKLEAHPWNWQVRVSWGWKPLVGIPLLFVTRTWWKVFCKRSWTHVCGPWDVAVCKKLSLGVLVTLSFFVGAEKLLEWRNYEAPLPEIVIRGEESHDVVDARATISDRELLWKFNPGAEFNGRTVNQLGFLDREVDPVKAVGVKRVICMGDSCTGQGIPPYSGFLHELLTNQPPHSQSWEAFNMGVHGYSSLQGLRLFQRMGRTLQPDVVTVFYGWNDHWLGSQPDSFRMAMVVHPWHARLLRALKQKRFVQWLAHRANPARSLAYGKSKQSWGPRVPHKAYAWTLRTFVTEIRSAGAVPILVTAPRANELTEVLLEKQARSLEETTRWHDEYVEITRRVGNEMGVHVLDLAMLMQGDSADVYFSGDGIHFTREGRQVIARHLYNMVLSIESKE